MFSDAEPSIDEFPFAGWVPTANGRLSFRHLGEARFPTESVYANVTTSQVRLLLAYQRRVLSDVLFRPLVHYVFDFEGAFWFVMVARSIGTPGDSEQLAGTTYIYKSKPDWRNSAEPTVRPVIYKLNRIRVSVSAERDQLMEAEYGRALGVLQETADIEVDFRLQRSGEVFVSKPRFRDSQLELTSSGYARQSGNNLPKWVADQAYFFLRDMCHAHQHHAPSEDTILILQDRTDRVRWRRNVIYSLQHYIIRAKRFGDRKSLFQSAGVLGYCMSFRAICERTLGARAVEIPPFNDDALLQSLTARASEREAVLSEWSAVTTVKMVRAANVRAFALALSAIFVALLVMLVQPSIERQGVEHLAKLSETAAENLGPILGALGLALTFVWVVTHRSWRVQFLVRDILELSNVRRVRFATAYFVGAAVALLGAGVLAQDAILDVWSAATSLVGDLLSLSSSLRN